MQNIINEMHARLALVFPHLITTSHIQAIDLYTAPPWISGNVFAICWILNIGWGFQAGSRTVWGKCFGLVLAVGTTVRSSRLIGSTGVKIQIK